jgi:hypothetical protein
VGVIVTTDIGPRVIAYRFVDGENILAEIGPSNVVETELGAWHAWGGHRLWHAPECKPRSYSPDNDPVEFEIGENGIHLMQPIEQATGIEKEMIVTLADEGTDVSITHRLTNRGMWPVELAPWALTIMNGGGTTIIPNEPFIPHTVKLLPARPMVMWNYTDFSDPRWTLGKKYIRLRTDESIEAPQKVGVGNTLGWAGFLRGKTFFMKRFPYIEDAEYPDGGCNCETFTSGTFMEVESVGPLVMLEQNDSVTYEEIWSLFDGVEAGETEDDLDAAITPLISQACACEDECECECE